MKIKVRPKKGRRGITFKIPDDTFEETFETYHIALDNQNLAIQLSGLIAENKRLRERLGLPKRDYSKVEEKIRYYLS